MSLRHRLTALLIGLVLMQPSGAAHDDHCASHGVEAAQQASGHHQESPVQDTGDCEHTSMDACATMTSCATLAAEPQQRAVSAPRVAMTLVSAGALAPTFRTSAPETPPPRS